MSKQKRAIITGISGQDAAYLAQFLLEKGYKVYGTDRRVSSGNEIRHWRLKELGILDKVEILYATLESYSSILEAFRVSQPDEIYHLAAQSFVTNSFQDEFSTVNINVLGTLHVLKAFREVVPNARLYNASSSEQFGKVQDPVQNEKTRFYPRSIYGCAKNFCFDATRLVRDSGFHASSGLLYNHESPLRGRQFVTRKITASLVECYHEGTKFSLGNLESKRDWGYSFDFVRQMHLILQQDIPDDYVVATNETHSIREFLEESAKVLGELVSKEIKWENFVSYDEKLVRPCEVDLLIGNPQKAKDKLGWSPTVKFHELVRIMITADYSRYLDGTLKFKS